MCISTLVMACDLSSDQKHSAIYNTVQYVVIHRVELDFIERKTQGQAHFEGSQVLYTEV
jgi:hypothetical protein